MYPDDRIGIKYSPLHASGGAEMTPPVTLVTQSLGDLSHNNGKKAQMFRTWNLTIEIHVVTMARRGYRRN